MRGPLVVLGLIAAFIAPSYAEEPVDQIFGLSLGQRALDPTDTGGLQAAFGPAIAKNLKGLMFDESAAPHYLLDLGNDRMLSVWFDGKSSERPIYWLDLTVPKQDSMNVRDGADVLLKALGANLDIAQEVAVYIDQSLAATLRSNLKQAIIANATQHPVHEMPINDPGFRLRLLGEQFRGGMQSWHSSKSGRPVFETELFDGTIARKVLQTNP